MATVVHDKPPGDIPPVACLEVVHVARKLTPAEIDDLISRYRSGESQNELATAFGISQPSVSRWVIKRGANISRSEAEARKWAAMTADQRAAQVASAHTAVRGMTRTADDLERRALGKQRTGAHATEEELALARHLNDLGVETISQQAIGKYNLDVGAHPVAVELFGGGWHADGRHRARLPERIEYLADAGWNLLIVWTHRVHRFDMSVVAQDALTYLERSRRDPTLRRQYRVIWSDGQLIAAGSVDDDEVTLVPTGISGTYARRS